MSVFRPVVTDDDRFLRCTDAHTIIEHALPHRTVWGMVFSPRQRAWLVQKRRADKDVCPNLWDVSCGGHVDCVAGRPETYAAAYDRELGEELGLAARFVWRMATDNETLGSPIPTLDLGHTREYHVHPAQGNKNQLEREHVQRFLSLYDGDVVLGADAEPQEVAWVSSEQIREDLIYRDHATIALEHMLRWCEPLLQSWGI